MVEIVLESDSPNTGMLLGGPREGEQGAKLLGRERLQPLGKLDDGIIGFMLLSIARLVEERAQCGVGLCGVEIAHVTLRRGKIAVA